MGRVDLDPIVSGQFCLERNIQDLHVLSRHFDTVQVYLRILHVLNWIPA